MPSPNNLYIIMVLIRYIVVYIYMNNYIIMVLIMYILILCIWSGSDLTSITSLFGKDVNICELPAEVGPCKAAKPRFYFNSETDQCEKFIYSGCGGNGNNFKTRQKCRRACYCKLLECTCSYIHWQINTVIAYQYIWLYFG